MTIRRTLAALLCAGAMLAQPVRAAAVTDIPEQKQYLSRPQSYAAYQRTDQFGAAGNPNAAAIAPKAVGDIIGYYDNLNAGIGCVYYYAETLCGSVMRRTGVKNVTLQYSPNPNNVTYADVANYGDFYNNNSSFFSLSRSFPTVRGAGYYRIKVTHFAYNNPAKPQNITIFSSPVKIYY